MGTQLPSQNGTEPIFVVAKRLDASIKMPLGMELGLSAREFVLDVDPPLPKRERISQFSAHVYCGQTAAWMKMPLGTMVNPGLRNIVLDGYQLPLL